MDLTMTFIKSEYNAHFLLIFYKNHGKNGIFCYVHILLKNKLIVLLNAFI